MRKTIALWSLTLLVSVSASAPIARAAGSWRKSLGFASAHHWDAPPQAAQAKQPGWKSRDEYEAFMAMANEKDPNKKISGAEAFIQKFADSDFKAVAYAQEIQAYFQLGDSAKAIDAAKKVLELDPDNIDALAFLSYVFPFVFKAEDPDATSKLSRAESDAKHGLEVLAKIQKPANITDEQFTQFVKPKRAVFNGAVGFVALQRKDYPAAIAGFKAAAEDNPSDIYTFYRLGLAYLYSSPPDYDHGVWYIARAVSLANASKNPAGAEIDKFLRRAYVNYHGNEQGLQDILTQAAGAPNPPEGFKVAPMETPKPTGNPNVDNFNQLTFPLKLGGEKAQKTWDAIKGQALGLGGSIDSIEPGKEAGTSSVHIDILDQSKAADGVYDIELIDSTQPKVKNLSKGDLVRFQGTIDSYTATPNLVLTLRGTIVDPDPLPDEPKPKEKPKPKPKPRPTRRPVRKAAT
jgi:tetratricopeptide (TPR) repeat protein